MKYFLYVISLFLPFGSSSAQPVIQWQKSLGGSEFDEAKCIQQTTDGGYIVTGDVLSSNGDVFGNHGGHDFWVIKLNETGSVSWKKALGGTNNDWPSCIQQTNDGGFIVAGYTESNNGEVFGNHGGKDAWVVKLSSNGAIQWGKCYGGSKWEEASAIRQTNDGGYIFAGLAQSSDGDVSGVHGDLDYWVVKLDNVGTILWQKAFGGSGEDMANDVRQSFDGGYVVTGKSDSEDGDVIGNHGSDDYWVVKLNSMGEIEWTKALGGNSADVAEEIWQTTDSGFILVGYVLKNSSGDITGHHGGIYDAWVAKINSLGHLMWQRALGGSWLDYGRSVQQTNDGMYIVAGSTVSNDGDVSGLHSENYSDAWVVKLNDLGEIVWQKTIGGTNDDACFSIQQTNDGGYITAGYNWSTDGDATTCHGYNDFWIVKLSPESSPTSAPQTLPLQVYPNPAQQSISLNIYAQDSALTVNITDLLGRALSRQTIPSDGKVDIAALPNGLYLLTAITPSGKVYTGKFSKMN